MDSINVTSWPTWRKVAALLFIALCFVALLCATLYLAGAMFLLLNKADARQARLTSIVRYWALYSGYPEQRKKLIGSISLSVIGLLVALPLGALAASRQRRSLHGDARFASYAEIRHARLVADPQSREPSILIGRAGRRFLALPGQLSVMLSAPTRSGKGVGVVIPNLLSWPHSSVVLDIKGENYDVTAGYRASCGQAVFAFSPFDDEGRSHRWNPLSTLRTDDIHRVGDLLAIGQVFFPVDAGTSSEAFFSDQARNLFLGLGLLLLESPELPRTIGEMLRQSSGKGRALNAHVSDLIASRRDSSKPFSDECTDALQRLLSNSENTLSSIVATFSAPLVIFADTVVDAATSANDFELEDVRRRPMTIYVRIPPNRLANARPLLNLFFSQLVALNTQLLPCHDKSLKYQCLLINDEFAAMGRVGVISNAVAFLAGYNLRLLTVVQAMSQLDSVYGDKEARTFATNHGLQILFAPREQRDADEYSAMLGHFTTRAASRGRSRSFSGRSQTTISHNESDQRRALLLPQEFKELSSERLIAIMENCRPILARKIRYYREKVFVERLRPAPSVPRMDMALHIAKVQQRWRAVEGDLPDDVDLTVEALAYDWAALPDVSAGAAADVAETLINFLAGSAPASGGAIDAVADEDGVLIDSDAPAVLRATRELA